MRRSVLLLAALAALLLGACGGDDDGEQPGELASDDCAEVEAPEPKDEQAPEPPRRPRGESVTFETSCGSFTVTLDAERAPLTAASFEHLATEGFYDGTTIHRVSPTVIQGGDPGGDGTGGPGYSVVEPPPDDLSYTRGVVAMAKTPFEPAGTSGSQFFVVTAADAGLLPEFALVGEVTDGFATIESIDALGPVGGDGAPSRPVVIDSASVNR